MDTPKDQKGEDIGRKRPHLMVDNTSPDSPVTIGVLRGLLNDTLDDKLQSVFQRLDSIEQTVKGTHETLKDIPNLKQELINTKQDLEMTKQDLQIIRTEVMSLREETIKLESYSRRDNLKFFGITDTKGETGAQSEQAVKTFYCLWAFKMLRRFQ
jgi:hypothetical protein